MIPTRSFEAGSGLDRLGFLRDYVSGVAAEVRRAHRFDILVAGYPPPGLVWALSRVTDRRTAIIADIRDLWPDALVPSGQQVIGSGASSVGRLLAQELRLSSGAVAMSATMLARAPRGRRLAAVPGCVAESIRAAPCTLNPGSGLSVMFVGSFSRGFDFEAMLVGWQRFLDRRSKSPQEPVMRICGAGVRAAEVHKLADAATCVEIVGWVPADEIGTWLANADVGLVPTRPRFGTTLNNKALEYVGAGLYVLNSFEPEAASIISGLGLGEAVASTADSWALGFAAVERDLHSLRGSRQTRRALALTHFGRERIEPAWFQQLCAVLPGEQTDSHRLDPPESGR